ncbi:hypothetical protein [Streptomyces sp. NPDC017964]|uniref:hypothetical protein n=1 Tax=Streptomyces sp. NPDC017964 TaxID=3365022 RepID=UPI0037B4A1CE
MSDETMDRQDGPPLDTDASFKRGRRRRYTFSQLPDWVLFSDKASPGAKVLYWALYLHVNQERKDSMGDTRVWPGQKALLYISGIKSRTSLRKYLVQLEKISAVEWETGRNPKNPQRLQTVYTVHEEPEEGYQGPANIEELYAAYRSFKAEQEASGSQDPA